ncbi:MAG: PadR family transcriptional regulator [Anaerolineales bacterium]
MIDKKRTGFGSYHIRYLALGLLMDEPGHGYHLDQKLEDDFRMIWRAGQTKLYVTLSGLEEDGLLRSEMEPQENRPDRKIYHLTDQGRKKFLSWVEKPVRSMRAVRVELIAKLRFYYLLDLPGVEGLIEAQQKIFRDMIQEWEKERKGEKDPFMVRVYDFRIRQASFIIDWLEEYQGEMA